MKRLGVNVTEIGLSANLALRSLDQVVLDERMKPFWIGQSVKGMVVIVGIAMDQRGRDSMQQRERDLIQHF